MTGEKANGSGGQSVARFQVEQPLDALFRLWVAAKQRRLPKATAAQDEPVQQAPLQTLEFRQRRRQSPRVAGQTDRSQVRVELARPRQRELE